MFEQMEDPNQAMLDAQNLREFLQGTRANLLAKGRREGNAQSALIEAEAAQRRQDRYMRPGSAGGFYAAERAEAGAKAQRERLQELLKMLGGMGLNLPGMNAGGGSGQSGDWRSQGGTQVGMGSGMMVNPLTARRPGGTLEEQFQALWPKLRR